MTNLKRLMIALCVSSLAVLCLLVGVGCQQSNPRNDLLVDIAVSQGVVRFVEAGATAADEAERRERLISALSVARQFVSGSAYRSSKWADAFVWSMYWDSLSVEDQVLLAQFLAIVVNEVELRVAIDGPLIIYPNRVIDVAINTASSM